MNGNIQEFIDVYNKKDKVRESFREVMSKDFNFDSYIKNKTILAKLLQISSIYRNYFENYENEDLEVQLDDNSFENNYSSAKKIKEDIFDGITSPDEAWFYYRYCQFLDNKLGEGKTPLLKSKILDRNKIIENIKSKNTNVVNNVIMVEKPTKIVKAKKTMTKEEREIKIKELLQKISNSQGLYPQQYKRLIVGFVSKFVNLEDDYYEPIRTHISEKGFSLEKYLFSKDSIFVKEIAKISNLFADYITACRSLDKITDAIVFNKKIDDINNLKKQISYKINIHLAQINNEQHRNTALLCLAYCQYLYSTYIEPNKDIPDMEDVFGDKIFDPFIFRKIEDNMKNKNIGINTNNNMVKKTNNQIKNNNRLLLNQMSSSDKSKVQISNDNKINKVANSQDNIKNNIGDEDDIEEQIKQEIEKINNINNKDNNVSDSVINEQFLEINKELDTAEDRVMDFFNVCGFLTGKHETNIQHIIGNKKLETISKGERIAVIKSYIQEWCYDNYFKKIVDDLCSNCYNMETNKLKQKDTTGVTDNITRDNIHKYFKQIVDLRINNFIQADIKKGNIKNTKIQDLFHNEMIILARKIKNNCFIAKKKHIFQKDDYEIRIRTANNIIPLARLTQDDKKKPVILQDPSSSEYLTSYVLTFNQTRKDINKMIKNIDGKMNDLLDNML